jgi:hypothetical protein
MPSMTPALWPMLTDAEAGEAHHDSRGNCQTARPSQRFRPMSRLCSHSSLSSFPSVQGFACTADLVGQAVSFRVSRDSLGFMFEQKVTKVTKNSGNDSAANLAGRERPKPFRGGRSNDRESAMRGECVGAWRRTSVAARRTSPHTVLSASRTPPCFGYNSVTRQPR